MATTVRPRTIKKLEKPRSLKISPPNPTNDSRITVDIVSLIDNVSMHLNSGFYDQTLQSNIVTMCNHLKLYYSELESIYKDQLDRAFIAIRNGSQDERLDMTTRVHLLELIELRAKQWHNNESMNNYYSQKLSHLDNQTELLTPDTPSMMAPSFLSMNSASSPSLLGPSEVIKSSGKFANPTRIPGRNYIKDEIIIRNSDSGKVNPGAKERLVQITGTSEDKILYAKDLIKDTIQRNASPVRLGQSAPERIGGSSSSLNSSASDESNRLQQQHVSLHSSAMQNQTNNDANIGEYKYTVTVGAQSLKITGSNFDLVWTAKLVLDSFFSGEHKGLEYYPFEDEPAMMMPLTPTTPKTPSSVHAGILKKTLSNGSGVALSAEKLKEPSIPEIEPIKVDSSMELSYEFLMQCAKGPFARRPPADWDRIQKECPNIVRKVDNACNNTNVSWLKNDKGSYANAFDSNNNNSGDGSESLAKFNPTNITANPT